MSLHEEITAAFQIEIEALGVAVVLSPTSLALAVQRRFIEQRVEPHIEYTSLEHLKQMARRALARRYDTEGDENEAHQGEMFAGQLQDRYPLPKQAGDEPSYKLRGLMTAEEVAWNVKQLRKSATARLEHADALQAWSDGRQLAA